MLLAAICQKPVMVPGPTAPRQVQVHRGFGSEMRLRNLVARRGSHPGALGCGRSLTRKIPIASIHYATHAIALAETSEIHGARLSYSVARISEIFVDFKFKMYVDLRGANGFGALPQIGS